MKCAQQHTADRHTRHTHTHWGILAHTRHTQCYRLPSPGTPTAAHQRKKHSVLILIEKLLIFHASSSRDGGSRGQPRPLLTHTHTCTQLCLLTHLHMPTHTHTHMQRPQLFNFCQVNFLCCQFCRCVCVACVWVCACVCVCVLVLLVPCSVSG